MTLVKALMTTLTRKDVEEGLKSMRAKGDEVPLHQVFSGEGAEEQAGDYARELIARGFLKNTPVALDCDQPMSEHMVETALKDAKGGLLLVTNIHKLARHESFVAEATRALEGKKCTVIICGPNKGLDIFFADEPELKKFFPPRVDMDSAEVKAELTEHLEREKAAAVERATVVQAPIQAMKQLTYKKP